MSHDEDHSGPRMSAPSAQRTATIPSSGVFRLQELLASRGFLLWVTALGLFFRLLLLVFTQHGPTFADEDDYQSIAMSMLTLHRVMLHGLTSAFRPMGEPLLIAALYSIFGQHLILVKLLQELLLTALPVLCWRLARTVGLSLIQANLAALLVAFNPALAFATSTVYPTALTTVLLTAGVISTGAAARFGSLGKAAAGALYLGLAGLFTTVLIPLPALIGMVFFWKRYFRLATVVVVVGLLPSCIWIARNRVALHTWTIATNGGLNLYLGANDEATPRSGNWVAEPATEAGEVIKDKIFADRGRAWISTHPARWAELWIARAVLILDSVGKPKTAGTYSGIAGHVVGWLMFPLTCAGIIGLILLRRNPEILFTSLALALIVASSATTIVKPRFRFPCDPLLTVTAIAALTLALRPTGLLDQNSPFSKLRSRHQTKLSVSGADRRRPE